MAIRNKPVYKDPTRIFSPHKNMYWQCGMWVDREIDATTYPSKSEAELVVALRHLGAVDYVKA